MKTCVTLSFLKLSILLVKLTSTCAYQSVNAGEDNRQVVYNILSSLQGEQWFRRLREETEASGKSESLKQAKLISMNIDRTKMTGSEKFGNYFDGDIGKIQDRYFKAASSSTKSVLYNLKNEQRLNYNDAKRVRKDIKTEKQTKTEQTVRCEVASLSCRDCCENSNNCSHKTNFCRCDPQCTFYNDCCVDYETFCGRKQRVSFRIAAQGLSCIKPKYGNTRGHSERIWLINKCPHTRLSGEITRKCEIDDQLELNITNLPYLVPVIGSNNLIYRNEFCAKCNGIDQLEHFGLNIKCFVVPPVNTASLTELVEFALEHCERSRSISVFRYVDQQIRECNRYFRNVCPSLKEMNEKCDRNCSSTDDCILKAHWCNLNSSEWVDDVKQNITNEQGSSLQDRPAKLTLSLQGIPLVSLAPFSVTLRLSRGRRFSQVQTEKCPHIEQFYDQYLETCRYGQPVPPVKKDLEIFYVAMWLDVRKTTADGLLTLNKTISRIRKVFNLESSQIRGLNTRIIENGNTLVVFFKLELSNEQTLLLAKTNYYIETNDEVSYFGNISRNFINALLLKKLLFFPGKFNITISNETFTVFKTTSRQLACIRKQTYPQGTYASVSYGEYYYINSSGKTFAKSQVFFEENMNKSISVCEQIVFSSCVGRRVNLTSEEFVKFDNLSIFYNRTKTIYDFGEYDIEDGQIVMCIPTEPSTQFPFNYRNTLVIKIYLTLTCLVLSLFCLFLVILTYIIFPELRNLPGKNILSLSVSLFLAQLLWLISNRRYASTVCHVMAVIQHYAFLVSFLAMAIIAWNTHSVFASKDVRKNASKKREKKKFHKYSAIVWVLPAMFVAACVLVDQQDVYAVYVNEQWCWFGNMQAQIYLFVLPVGLLLLFNFVFFALIVFRIQRVRSSTRLIHSDIKTRNMFWIYFKISALMGFSWLFGFIDVFLESTNLVFSYLFIIFASLQGVYIALAFVMKKEIWEKYKKSLKTRKRKKFKPDYRCTLLENLSKSRETRV